MEQLPYLAKVNLCWLLFAACHWLLFRRHTFFKLNRAYLLATLTISMIVPALEFEKPIYILPQQVLEASFIYHALPNTQVVDQGMKWDSIIFFAYLAGALVLLLKFLKGLFGLTRLMRSALNIPMNGFTLVLPTTLPSKKSGSFSFLKFMVLSPDDYANHFETIFNHEAVHIKQMHSLDILLVELLKILFWFNPALWLYKIALQETHEYLADQGAENRDQYAAFLISYAKHAPVQSISNQFFNSSLLRKRVHMMYKDRTPRWLQGKYLLLLPIFAFTALVLAAQVRPMLLNKQSHKEPEQYLAIATNPGPGNIPDRPISGSGKIRKGAETKSTVSDSLPKLKLERWPYFTGGRKELHKFLARNIIYPAKALKDSVQGQALVSFLLNEEGLISDIKIEKGPRQDVNEEAARVVALMPRWVPAISGGKAVSVRYTIGILFNIEVDKLPLAIKEESPAFFTNTIKYIPPQMASMGKENLQKFFESSRVDFQDSIPPATSLYRYNYGYRMLPPLPGKFVDLKIKLPK